MKKVYQLTEPQKEKYFPYISELGDGRPQGVKKVVRALMFRFDIEDELYAAYVLGEYVKYRRMLLAA